MRDDEFLRTKVPMTKEEVRAISLDKLRLAGKHTLLDIGAGTGSVSMQAALEHPKLQVTAVEHTPEAIDIMTQNMDHFHIKNINLIEGEAPAVIPDQAYDAIFVGGSGKNLKPITDFAADHLVNGGTLVLNFILLENAFAAFDLLQAAPFDHQDMVEVGVLRWHQLGYGHFFKPQNPTIIMSATRKER